MGGLPGRGWCAGALALLGLCACEETRLAPTVALVNVDPSVDLGVAYVGDSVPGNFAVYSTGTGRVRVTGLASTDPQLQAHLFLDAPAMTVPTGGSLPIVVLWTPTTAGELTAQIVVSTDVEDASQWAVEVHGTANPIPSCDDGNACTDDRFNRLLEQCEHENNFAACDDGSACTRDDQCALGACRGSPVRCDDGSICTRDLCDPLSGCVFVSDAALCNDGDPCTTDECHPTYGCLFPDAPDGTGCGSVSCAEAHICIWGECRTLDISGRSDGYPCSDGDRCTDPDTCQAGECVGGPPLFTDPTIVAEVETFGGEGSMVATDGYRYLFADRDAVRVTVLGGDGKLQHVSTLPLAARLPVLFAPGEFVVATQSGLALIDATDPAAPVLRWEHATNANVTHLAAAEGGLVYATDPFYPAAARDRVAVPVALDLFFVPADSAGAGLDVWLPNGGQVIDLDVDGANLAWIDSYEVNWARIDSTGQLLEHVVYTAPPYYPYPPGSSRVSVQGRRVALWYPNELDVFEVSDVFSLFFAYYPDGYAVPDSLVIDLALVQDALYLLRPDGVAWFDVSSFAAGAPADPGVPYLPQPMLIDRMSGNRLDRGLGHLLVSGTLALPLRQVAASQLERVSGPWHGTVTALTDGAGGEILLGGRASVGRLSLADQTLAGWALTPTGSDAYHPRVLRGATHDVAVEHDAMDSYTGYCPNVDYVPQPPCRTMMCSGPTALITAADASQQELLTCGLYYGTFDAAAGRLWAYTDTWPDTMDAMPPRNIMAWDLTSGTLDTQLADTAPSTWAVGVSRLRTSSLGDQVAIFTAGYDSAPPQPVLGVRVFDPNDPVSPLRLTAELPVAWDYASFTPNRGAIDGSLVLYGQTGRVSLFDLNSQTLLAEFAPANSAPQAAQVLAMQDGRAWLGWQAADPAAPSRLSQIAYDGAAPLVSSEGDVVLPDPPLAVYDAGEAIVASTASRVVVIAPACR